MSAFQRRISFGYWFGDWVSVYQQKHTDYTSVGPEAVFWAAAEHRWVWPASVDMDRYENITYASLALLVLAITFTLTFVTEGLYGVRVRVVPLLCVNFKTHVARTKNRDELAQETNGDDDLSKDLLPGGALLSS